MTSLCFAVCETTKRVSNVTDAKSGGNKKKRKAFYETTQFVYLICLKACLMNFNRRNSYSVHNQTKTCKRILWHAWYDFKIFCSLAIQEIPFFHCFDVATRKNIARVKLTVFLGLEHCLGSAVREQILDSFLFAKQFSTKSSRHSNSKLFKQKRQRFHVYQRINNTKQQDNNTDVPSERAKWKNN